LARFGIDHLGTEPRGLGKADRDLVALGIAVAALILFVGTGGAVLPGIFRSWMGVGSAPEMLLTNAVLLNIALLIFGWRRYNELHAEVGERRRAEERARELAETDPLTGCLNRRSGGPAIDALGTDAHATHREVAVLMIDIDNFKRINDLNGHRMGDAVLVETARRIRSMLPERGVLARIGGDEFLCALPFERGDQARIEQFAASLVERISAPIEDDGCVLEATISLGIACSGEEDGPLAGGGSEKLIHRADLAMYHAKRQGRNGSHWFQPYMEHEQRLRNELEAGIRQGVAAGEFVPFYEQQVDLETGELVGFEMLARWQSPRFGTISPDVFIPIAEEMELISELSESLIRQALLDAKEWDPRLTLSVNISPVQLRDPWFAQKLLKLLADSGFPPERLEIEITESCLHENIAAVRAIVMSLKNQNIRVSLDDFGTGYSSLSQLRMLPFDRLKIDRSFVSELAHDDGSRELIKAIVSLGTGLAMPVTAEGVESASVLEVLRSMGDFKGQGYFYGQPEDAETTRGRLAALDLLKDAQPISEPTAAAPEAELRKAG
jgi:diguanylate cyclase (GGDEF)-like protein